MISMQLKLDSKNSAMRALEKLGVDSRRINKLILGRVGQSVVSYIQREKLTGRPLNRRSGGLAQGMTSRFVDDQTIEVGPTKFYGEVHEKGATIVPRNAQFLHFFLPDGTEIFTKKVIIPARPWLRPGIEEYLATEAETLIDRTLQQQLDKAKRSA